MAKSTPLLYLYNLRPPSVIHTPVSYSVIHMHCNYISIYWKRSQYSLTNLSAERTRLWRGERGLNIKLKVSLKLIYWIALQAEMTLWGKARIKHISPAICLSDMSTVANKSDGDKYLALGKQYVATLSDIHIYDCSRPITCILRPKIPTRLPHEFYRALKYYWRLTRIVIHHCCGIASMTPSFAESKKKTLRSWDDIPDDRDTHETTDL